MIIIIAIVSLILIIYYRYQHINEEFQVNKFTFFSLNSSNYPETANDHFFYNNPPISDSQVLGKLSGNRYCNNSKIMPYRQHNYTISCANSKSVINDLFTIDVTGLIDDYYNITLNKIEKMEESVDENNLKELKEIINKYKAINDEIIMSKKFIEENKNYADKYMNSNDKLTKKVENLNYETNKNTQETITLKEINRDLKNSASNLHKYTRYLLLMLVIITVVYLFNTKINNTNHNNNVMNNMSNKKIMSNNVNRNKLY